MDKVTKDQRDSPSNQPCNDEKLVVRPKPPLPKKPAFAARPKILGPKPTCLDTKNADKKPLFADKKDEEEKSFDNAVSFENKEQVIKEPLDGLDISESGTITQQVGAEDNEEISIDSSLQSCSNVCSSYDASSERLAQSTDFQREKEVEFSSLNDVEESRKKKEYFDMDDGDNQLSFGRRLLLSDEKSFCHEDGETPSGFETLEEGDRRNYKEECNETMQQIVLKSDNDALRTIGNLSTTYRRQNSVTSKPKPSRPPPPPPSKITMSQQSKFQTVSNDANRSNESEVIKFHNGTGCNLGHSVTTSGYENIQENNPKNETNQISNTASELLFEESKSQEIETSEKSEAGNMSIYSQDGKIFSHQRLEPVQEIEKLKGVAGKDSSYSNESRNRDRTDGYRIPFVRRMNKAYIKERKQERKSCPPPEVVHPEATEEIQEKVESKWKCKSFTTEYQNGKQNSTEAKPELLQRLLELRKRSEIVANRKEAPSMANNLTNIGDDIDEEMEDAVFFDYVLVVKLRQSDGGLEPHISFRFPPKQKYDKELDPRVASIPQFCFPDLKNGMNTADYIEQHIGFAQSETFSFVLTDMVGQRHFGYCRQIQVNEKLQKPSASSLPEVYCIVSPFGLFGLYAQILDEVERQCAYSSSSVFVFLKAVLSHSLPKAGGSIRVSFYSGDSGGLKSLTLKRDGESALHEHVDLSYLFEKLPISVILRIVAALLLERRVILASFQLSLLSASSHGFISLLYPFTWQHTYIPVLPYKLVDMCCLPTPYLLGVLSGCLQDIADLPIDEAIIVDLDEGKITRDVDEDSDCNFPTQIANQIESSLKQNRADFIAGENGKKEKNLMITDIFVEAYLSLIGHFTGYLASSDDEEFKGTEFYRSCKPKEVKRFVKNFIKTQAFQDFIHRYVTDSSKNNGLFETKLLEWQNSRKAKGTESAWHKFKGKLKTGHR